MLWARVSIGPGCIDGRAILCLERRRAIGGAGHVRNVMRTTSSGRPNSWHALALRPIVAHPFASTINRTGRCRNEPASASPTIWQKRASGSRCAKMEIELPPSWNGLLAPGRKGLHPWGEWTDSILNTGFLTMSNRRAQTARLDIRASLHAARMRRWDKCRRPRPCMPASIVIPPG